jgi:hypothetical protein
MNTNSCIYKYVLAEFIPFDHPITFDVTVPLQSKLRRIGIQNGKVCAWVEFSSWVKAGNGSQILRVLQVPTGVEFDPERLEYVSTEFISPFVYHYFARNPVS